MANQKEIHNIELFPMTHHIPISSDQGSDGSSEPESKMPHRHALTPVKAMKVEYWHQGEQPEQEWKSEPVVKHKQHSRRADQFGILLIVCAIVVVALVAATLYLNSKRYLLLSGTVAEPNAAVVDFYQGNHTFSQKVAEEKAAKLNPGHQIHGISAVNEDLEVPLSEQMNSMSEKMKKMRSVKQTDEPAPATPDTGPKVGLGPLKPTKDANFQSPLEFNNALPKELQKTP